MHFDDPFTTSQSSAGVRAGDAEREQAAEGLRRHHAEGRITDAEFEQRVARCYAARTLGDLDLLFADLPRRDRGLSPAGGPAGHAELWRIGRHPVAVAIAALVVVWTLAGAFASAVGPWHPYPHPFLGPLILAFVVWRLVVRRRRHGAWGSR